MELFTLKILVMGILLGLDNFFVSAGLGELSLSKKKKVTLMALYFVAEVCLPLVGLVAAERLVAFAPLIEAIEILGLTIAVLLVLFVVRYSRFFSRLATSKSNHIYLIYFLPFLLGLDNLLAGAAFYASGIMVLVMGAISVITCGVGLVLGEWIKTHTFMANKKPGLLSAFCLAGVALVVIIGELA